ncbi:MAG: hypothetical protein ACFB14_28080 [Leptolyngbyaceae cyanobacterium]
MNTQSYVVPNVGHGWNLEAPGFFTTIVRDWIEQRPLQLQTVG